jgi:hypothetical protein
MEEAPPTWAYLTRDGNISLADEALDGYVVVTQR